MKCYTYQAFWICTTTDIVEQTVRDYINYYNSIRIQAKLNNQSPIHFRRLAA
ncbi:IS3 family transposase [Paenibacillus sp. QZ-Y1]|uniref:IS3 family transposase n=1 Tax=Paenibacillus sp. QZ-Y1 TaxID=3414511 RepID=UPI003F78B6B2